MASYAKAFIQSECYVDFIGFSDALLGLTFRSANAVNNNSSESNNDFRWSRYIDLEAVHSVYNDSANGDRYTGLKAVDNDDNDDSDNSDNVNGNR
ncbi:unnamed protein product [Nippostrongylus brasiliensis]|uniref:Peptidase A1 domain-containing protein n=1 Tax=Nippostrongylus brasiliensis TaxID=27835 RepID=A0A0N4XVZ0_NIPBR|nr:unnamed protein product [Nippostrongylus brasiliensis]